MWKFLTSIAKLLRDERGEIGDVDPPDDTPDKDAEEDQNKDPDDELFIDLDEKEEKVDEEAKKVADEAKAKESEEETKKLRSEVDAFKEKEKTWKTESFQARKYREAQKELEAQKDEKPLTDTQLAKLLGDATTEGDSQVHLNVLKYLAQRVSKGEVKEAVTAAEMSRKADDFTKQLEKRFPDIANPTSDMRADIDKTKGQLDIADHPYGDTFAVGFRLIQDMDALIESSYEAGKKDGLEGTADKKRKEEIKAKSLPSSTKSAYKDTKGLSESQLETATQMGLSQDQLPAYAKLVGKRPRTVSVEG